ncbi:MAG: ABC transporter permease [Psychrilyobacter sp.]
MNITSMTGNTEPDNLIRGIIKKMKKDEINDTKQNGLWKNIMIRLMRNKLAIIGLYYIIFLILLSLFATFFLDYSKAIDVNGLNRLQTPSLEHPFGTDALGRDVMSRIIFGARISIIVGLVSTTTAILIGGSLGAISGYYGGKFDNVIMRVIDMLSAIPGILLAIAIIASLGANIFTLIIALSIGGIAGYARTVRASVLEIRHQEYIEAIMVCGASDLRIILLHIIPNSLAPVIVRATLGVGTAVISTASLSYLGLGVQPPTPEWGRILAEGQQYVQRPYLTIIPGLAIVSIVLAFNFFGDGLRDALDPKLK